MNPVWSAAYSPERVEGAFCELRLYGVLRSSYKKFQKILHLGDPPAPPILATVVALTTRWDSSGPLSSERGYFYEAHQFGSWGSSSYGSDDRTDYRICPGEGRQSSQDEILRPDQGV